MPLLSGIPFLVIIRRICVHQDTKERKGKATQPRTGVGLVIGHKEERKATENLHVSVVDQQPEISGSPTSSNNGLSAVMVLLC